MRGQQFKMSLINQNDSYPTRPAPDSQSLGLKGIGFGQRLNIKIQNS
jgi:hypothetical protein